MVVAAASVHPGMLRWERTGCKECQRPTGCCGDDLGGVNDQGASAEVKTDSRERKIEGAAGCAQGVGEAIEQHAWCLCFEPKLERQNGRHLWLM